MFEGMQTFLLIWLAVGVSLVWLASQKQRGSAGLPLAYFLLLSLNHVPGAFLYLDADESNYTRIGFLQTIIGMVAFLGGVIIAKFIAAPKQQASAKGFTPQSLAACDRLALIYMSVGGVAYFVMLRLVANIPSGVAIVGPLGQLIMVGACLRFWVAKESRSRQKFWSTMALLPVFPLATLVLGGFLGFGTAWIIDIVSFIFAQSKRRVGFFLLAAPVVGFVGLSVFANYMIARDEIRQLVWYQPAPMGDRLQRIADVFLNFEWFDLSNWKHHKAINDRLNYNELTGLAIARLESGAVEYASGATFGKMIMGLVPRVLWPNKPVVGGGGEAVVSQFTGREFAEGTSVGAGQVLEFYVNFGTWGVIGGFALFGWLLGRMDSLAIECLYRGDQRRFLFWFLIALAFLIPGGNLIEVSTTAVASALTAYGIGYFMRRSWSTTEVSNLPGLTNRL
jgi:hypothetical protein